MHAGSSVFWSDWKARLTQEVGVASGRAVDAPGLSMAPLKSFLLAAPQAGWVWGRGGCERGGSGEADKSRIPKSQVLILEAEE